MPQEAALLWPALAITYDLAAVDVIALASASASNYIYASAYDFTLLLFLLLQLYSSF